MAAGDPYIDCSNSVPTDLILRDMIVQDENGKPAWRVYGSGGGGGGVYDLNSPTTVEAFLLPIGTDITGLTANQILSWILTGNPGVGLLMVDPDDINFGNVAINTFSGSQSFDVTGEFLQDNVTITSPSSRFIINTNNSSTNQSPIVLVPSGGIVNETIYVKANPLAEQNYSANISITSTGAISKAVSVEAVGIEITPAPFGDMFTEDFNPNAGTYTNVGTIAPTFTTGNLSVTGNGGGNFSVAQNFMRLAEVIWSGNNWYVKTRVRPSVSTTGQVGAWFGMRSINPVQGDSIYWGIYYASSTNNWSVVIFNTVGNSTIADSPTNLVLPAGVWAILEASMDENTLTITATNEITSNTASCSFTFNTAYPILGNIKPNTSQIVVGAPMSPWDISSIVFGSNYLIGVHAGYYGDSITSGYNAGSVADRHQNKFATATGKTIETFAGAGDRSIELSNPVALELYTRFFPQVIHILIGTNDAANSILLQTTKDNIDSIIDAFQTAGSRVYIGTCLARNGVNLDPINSWILAKDGVDGITVIDYYAASEDPSNPGDIDPAYSDDEIHPNAAFCQIMANMQVAAGMGV